MSKGPKQFIPISMKLSFLILFLLAAACLPIIFESAKYLEKVSFEREAQHLSEKVFSKSDSVETLLWSYIYSMEDIARFQMSQGRSIKQALRSEFELVSIWDSSQKRVTASVLNSKLDSPAAQIAQVLSRARSQWGIDLEQVEKGKHGIYKIHFKRKPYLLVLSSEAKKARVLMGVVRIDRLLNLVKKEKVSRVAVLDSNKKIIVHPDPAVMNSQQKLTWIETRANQFFGQIKRVDKAGGEYLASWVRLPQSVYVVGETSTELAQTPILKVKRRSIYLVLSVFAIAIALIFFFSKSLTVPLERLLRLTIQIASGNFDVRAQGAIRSRDEVGQLAQAFDLMATELAKGKKVRHAFDKLHGDELADELLRKGVQRGGVRREATVLFVDIRNFTSFSESAGPEEVVLFLNEFYDSLVKIINANGGTVDKFLGDGLLAVWGLHQHNSENPVHATKAALEIRIALNKLNKKRAQKALPPIDIGMGLHRGPVVVGMIGSEERMEYTVVGDTVNTASRIEGATKQMETDLLISQAVMSSLGDRFICRDVGQVLFKGKQTKIGVAEVDGYYDSSSQACIVRSFSDRRAA